MSSGFRVLRFKSLKILGFLCVGVEMSLFQGFRVLRF